MKTKTDAELLHDIHERFEVMMNTLECVLDPFNPVRAMIVCGAAGVGKSYNLIKRLDDASEKYECTYKKISGKCTELGLYQALAECSDFGSILLMDDVDVFDSETKLDLLKAALDSSKTRTVSYMSSRLQSMGIPNSIDFKGKIVFVTNKNFNKILEGESKLKEHIKALVTRGSFIDLLIHDNRAIMLQVEDVMKKTDIVSQYGITSEQANDILNFMKQNSENLIEPSLRMPVLISGYVKQFPDSWKRMVEINCIKRAL